LREARPAGTGRGAAAGRSEGWDGQGRPCARPCASSIITDRTHDIRHDAHDRVSGGHHRPHLACGRIAAPGTRCRNWSSPPRNDRGVAAAPGDRGGDHDRPGMPHEPAASPRTDRLGWTGLALILILATGSVSVRGGRRFISFRYARTWWTARPGVQPWPTGRGVQQPAVGAAGGRGSAGRLRPLLWSACWASASRPVCWGSAGRRAPPVRAPAGQGPCRTHCPDAGRGERPWRAGSGRPGTPLLGCWWSGPGDRP